MKLLKEGSEFSVGSKSMVYSISNNSCLLSPKPQLCRVHSYHDNDIVTILLNKTNNKS